MSGPLDKLPTVRPAVAWACLILLVVSIAVPSDFVRLPTTLFSAHVDETIGSAILTAIWAGLVLNGLWTGDMLILAVAVRSNGRKWASRTDDPWMFWSLAAFYSILTLVCFYFLVRALLAR